MIFQGLCSNIKALEVGEVLYQNHIVILLVKKTGNWIILKFAYLVIDGLVNLRRVLKVRGLSKLLGK